MSIYSKNESGTKVYRTRRNLSYRWTGDIDFGELIPAFRRFCLPGDVHKLGANIMVRYQPTLAPILNNAKARIRYFFVPLRLVDSNCETILTGSKNGRIVDGTLPKFPKMFNSFNNNEDIIVEKYSFLDRLGIPCINYKGIKDNKCMPSKYWYDSFLRIYFDYYRDENLSSVDDFNDFVSRRQKAMISSLPNINHYVSLPKDYFMSALPFELKGVAPVIPIVLNNPFENSVKVNAMVSGDNGLALKTKNLGGSADGAMVYNSFGLNSDMPIEVPAYELNNSFSNVTAGFNADDLRTMIAQTRIFERLARCGSRYTEYLNANFGIAPADGTLQRAQYLGGFTQPIVTTEVVQTAEDGTNPVGTLRGHGISNGGNTIKPFISKEFGVLYGILDVLPEIQYTQGIDRELTYDERFDFFNPSFQHLSEQEVRNGEVFVSNDGKNDDTFGFQGMYNELRNSRSFVTGDLRDGLKYWTQSIEFNSRPNLNGNFISSASYNSSFKKPFPIVENIAKPIIVDIYNIDDAYRPMVRYATPGLIDHN